VRIIRTRTTNGMNYLRARTCMLPPRSARWYKNCS